MVAPCCNLNLLHHTLTLSRFQINCVCDDIFQFHEFQLGCFVCNPAIRADFDPFPLITPPGAAHTTWTAQHSSTKLDNTQHTAKVLAHPHHKRAPSTRGCNHCRRRRRCGHQPTRGVSVFTAPKTQTTPRVCSVCTLSLAERRRNDGKKSVCVCVWVSFVSFGCRTTTRVRLCAATPYTTTSDYRLKSKLAMLCCWSERDE